MALLYARRDGFGRGQATTLLKSLAALGQVAGPLKFFAICISSQMLG